MLPGRKGKIDRKWDFTRGEEGEGTNVHIERNNEKIAQRGRRSGLRIPRVSVKQLNGLEIFHVRR